MALHYTKHAKEKMNVRQIEGAMIGEVLSRPERRYYDTLRNTEVAARTMALKVEVTTLVVAFSRRNDDCQIITIYPSKRFDVEAKRKVKSGRWVTIKGGADEG